MAFRERDIYSGVDQWRVGERGNTNNWPGTLAKDNNAVNGSGTITPYGRVVAGTVVALGPDDKLHPCGLAELQALVSSAVIVSVHKQAAKNFYVGDQVAVVTKQAQTRTLAITGVASTDVITTATVHGLMVGDTVEIAGLAGGDGLAAGSYTVATVPSSTTLTLTGVNFTTNITDGTLTVHRFPDLLVNITGTRNVAAVDRDTGAITLSGANFSAAAGDLLVKVGAYRPQGILAEHAVTRRVVYDVEETEDKLVSVALQGDGRTRYCPGITPPSTFEGATALVEILKGGPYADPVTGAKVTPKFAEFTFRDV